MTQHQHPSPITPPNPAPQPVARRRGGRFTRFVAIAMVLMIMPFLLVATAIAATGTVTVKVHERSASGVNLTIPVPALLFDLAAFAAPRLIPDDALADLRHELDPWRPALIETANAFEDCPSGVLVDVRSNGEHVVVSKQRGRYRVNVNSPDVDIQVSVPSRIMRRALQAVDLI